MSITDEQRRYYGELLSRFGRDPRSLGHRDVATQRERFERLARLFERETGYFTVHEIGAGFGDFGEYLNGCHPQAGYSGSEILEEFVEVARHRFPGTRFLLRDVTSEPADERYDFVTQSGALNGRLETSPDDWWAFIQTMLRTMYGMARKGIASNFLTTYGDAELRRPELHYQDPQQLTEFVNRELSRHFEIDAAGPLYEFTIRIYRPGYVHSHYPGQEFTRYFD